MAQLPNSMEPQLATLADVMPDHKLAVLADIQSAPQSLMTDCQLVTSSSVLYPAVTYGQSISCWADLQSGPLYANLWDNLKSGCALDLPTCTYL